MTFSQLIGSALKVLAEKACWDVAEIKTKGDRQLLKYLVSTCCTYNQCLKTFFIFLG
jgi:hypothetical protein